MDPAGRRRPPMRERRPDAAAPGRKTARGAPYRRAGHGVDRQVHRVSTGVLGGIAVGARPVAPGVARMRRRERPWHGPDAADVRRLAARRRRRREHRRARVEVARQVDGVGRPDRLREGQADAGGGSRRREPGGVRRVRLRAGAGGPQRPPVDNGDGSVVRDRLRRAQQPLQRQRRGPHRVAGRQPSRDARRARRRPPRQRRPELAKRRNGPAGLVGRAGRGAEPATLPRGAVRRPMLGLGGGVRGDPRPRGTQGHAGDEGVPVKEVIQVRRPGVGGSVPNVRSSQPLR